MRHIQDGSVRESCIVELTISPVVDSFNRMSDLSAIDTAIKIESVISKHLERWGQLSANNYVPEAPTVNWSAVTSVKTLIDAISQLYDWGRDQSVWVG